MFLRRRRARRFERSRHSAHPPLLSSRARRKAPSPRCPRARPVFRGTPSRRGCRRRPSHNRYRRRASAPRVPRAIARPRPRIDRCPDRRTQILVTRRKGRMGEQHAAERRHAHRAFPRLADRDDDAFRLEALLDTGGRPRGTRDSSRSRREDHDRRHCAPVRSRASPA